MYDVRMMPINFIFSSGEHRRGGGDHRPVEQHHGCFQHLQLCHRDGSQRGQQQQRCWHHWRLTRLTQIKNFTSSHQSRSS